MTQCFHRKSKLSINLGGSDKLAGMKYVKFQNSKSLIGSSSPPFAPAKERSYFRSTLPVTLTDRPTRSAQLDTVGWLLKVETIKLKIEDELARG